MNIFINFFAGIAALLSELLGFTSEVTNAGQPIVVTINQTPTTTPVLQKSLTENITISSSTVINSDLLTYSSKKYAFEIKYPHSLTEMGTSSSVEGENILSLGICPTEGEMCQEAFSIILRNSESIDDWYIKNTNGKYPSIKRGSIFEDIAINGLSARKIISPVDSTWRGGAPCYITAIYSKGKIFEICDNLNNEVTKSIISSFDIN